MFYDKNAEALLRQGEEMHQALLNQLAFIQPTEDYALFPTEDGNYTLQYQGVYLHDPEQPMQEVHNTLQEHCTPSASRLHVILGLGLGYLLDQTYQASDGHIVVYEPDLKLLRFVLENVDLSDYLGADRVRLTGSQADLLDYVRKKTYGQYQLDLLVLRGSAYLLAAEIPGLMQKLKEMELDRIQDFKTSRHFHFQWMKQVFDNYPYYAQCDSLDSMVGRFEGKPALVVSRGPSLDRSIDAVKALANSTVIIAVGGAIRRLWEAGVTPDFAVFYDANGMQEQLHGIPQEALDNITFILCPSTQRCTFTMPSRGKLFFLSQNGAQYCDWLDSVLKTRHYRLDGGGTVSMIAFQSAMAMGCNPVILVGQDLAFPNNQVYAGGIPLQVDENGYMALTPSDTLFAAPESLATTPGQNGEMLPTLKAYLSFIRHFEELAAKNAAGPQPIDLYNTSLGGAKLDGYTLRDLSQFIPELPAWKNGPALPEAPALSSAAIDVRQQNLRQGLRELRDAMNDATAMCEDLQLKLQRILDGSNETVQTLQTEYRNFNEHLQRHPFVSYIVMFEIIQFRQYLNTLTTDEALAAGGCQALVQLLGNCRIIFQENVMPWVNQAEETLQALYPGAHCTL